MRHRRVRCQPPRARPPMRCVSERSRARRRDVQHGSDTSCDEVLCHTNEHVQSHACVACPAGSTNDAGDGAASGDTVCASSRARPPVEQTPTSSECVVRTSACRTTCARRVLPGTTTRAATTRLVPIRRAQCHHVWCEQRVQRVQNHVCTACPAGTTNEAGDDASGANVWR